MLDKDYSDILTENKSNLENSNQFNPLNLHLSSNKKVSYNALDLFNHNNSLESLNFISNLLMSSLEEYKKKFQYEGFKENNDPFFTQIYNNSEKNDLQNNFKDPLEEFLAISNDIHLILTNNTDLTNAQKLDFCNNQRYFMKLYLKKMLIKINKA